VRLYFWHRIQIWDGKGSEKLKRKTKKEKHILDLILLDSNNGKYVFYNIICTFTLPIRYCTFGSNFLSDAGVLNFYF